MNIIPAFDFSTVRMPIFSFRCSPYIQSYLLAWAEACTSTICGAMIAASIKCLWWHCWVCLRVWGDKYCSGLSWPSDKKTRLCRDCDISQSGDKSANRWESKFCVLILEGDYGDKSVFMGFAWWSVWADKLMEFMCLWILVSCHE